MSKAAMNGLYKVMEDRAVSVLTKVRLVKALVFL